MPFNRNKIDIKKIYGLDSDVERLRFLAEFGAIAPSSHNTQPWLFRVKEKTLSVIPNLERRLPVGDSHNRQLYLSLGAAIANIKLAAAGYGLHYEVSYKEGEILSVDFVFQSTQPALFDKTLLQALIDRHTNRQSFTDKPLPNGFIENIKALAKEGIELVLVTEAELQDQVRQLVGESARAAFADKGFRRELSHWIKPSLDRYEDGMPGYTLLVPKPLSFILPLLIRFINLGAMQQKMHEDWLRNVPLYVIIGADDNIMSWLKAGELFERIAVLAQQKGLRLGVMGAPIETPNYADRLQQLLDARYRPQMFFRIGYGPAMPHPAPRLALNKVIS